MAQRCANCSADSPDGAKFCLECGTAFARVCPSCGHPAGAGKFCGECGSPLAAGATPKAAAEPAAAAGGPVSERRMTSVLFGDLVSFTTLSEQRDPEEVRELLSAYFAVARTVVGRYGGTIEKFIGDAVMAVWGVPVAHEDDAERAVRAGLDLVAEVTALGESVGAPGLAMRVGVVTGSVAVTLGATNEGMVAGDAVNTAARVQSAAEPGTVWTDGETRSLTAAAISYADMGRHELKGKAEPVALFRADAVMAGRAGAQRVDGLEAPLTGRDAEMRALKEGFHSVEGSGRSRLLLLEGQAGTGKTRLGWEFFKYVDGLSRTFAWHRGRCLSYGEGVTYWAFAEMMRSRFGLLEDDSQDAIVAKVAAGTRAVARDEAEAQWLASRMSALLSANDVARGYARADLFSAWAAYLERLGDSNPVILLFEDMQHADAGLLEFVDHLLVAGGATLFVILCARPELRERGAACLTGERSTVVTLSRLDDVAMAELVDGLVLDLPARARAAIVSRAEGVPLYAVETVRSLIDRDAVVPRDGHYVFDDPDGTKVDLAQLAAPTSLQTLIAARLDALTATERRVVQDASVLGLSFRQPGVERLCDFTPGEITVALLGLVRKGVIEPELDPRSPELGQYRFLQSLVREVAYGTLARKDRKARHLAAADHLASEGDLAESLAGVIAQHLLDALESSSATDPERPVVAARARTLFVSAAERAESLGSTVEALRCTQAALGLQPDEAELPTLHERAARTAALSGDNLTAVELGARAAAGHRLVGNTYGAAAGILWEAKGQQQLGRPQRAIELLEPLLVELADDPAASTILMQAHLTATSCYHSTGQREKRMRASLTALALGEQSGRPADVVAGLNTLAVMLTDLGAPTAYLALLERAVVISRANHLVSQLGRSLANLVPSHYPVDLAHACELVAEAVTVNTRAGEVLYLELSLANAGCTWWLAGRWADINNQLGGRLAAGTMNSSFSSALALAVAQVADATTREFPKYELTESEDLVDQMSIVLSTALAQAASGEVGPAAARASTAFRAAYFDGGSHEDVEIFWAATVELQLRAGDVAEASALLSPPLLKAKSRRFPLTRALQARLTGLVEAAQGSPAAESSLRTAESRFAEYGAPFYLARTRLELGRWLSEHGRRSEAEPFLTLARAAFEELGAAPSLSELDAVLAAAPAVTLPGRSVVGV